MPNNITGGPQPNFQYHNKNTTQNRGLVQDAWPSTNTFWSITRAVVCQLRGTNMEVRINVSFRVMHFGGGSSHGWRKAWLDSQMIQIRLLLFTAESAGLTDTQWMRIIFQQGRDASRAEVKAWSFSGNLYGLDWIMLIIATLWIHISPLQILQMMQTYKPWMVMSCLMDGLYLKNEREGWDKHHLLHHWSWGNKF